MFLAFLHPCRFLLTVDTFSSLNRSKSNGSSELTFRRVARDIFSVSAGRTPSPTAKLSGVSVNPGAFGTQNAPAPVDLPGNTTVGQPAIVMNPGNGPSPDFAGTVLLLFGQDGETYIRSGMLSVTTWAANGGSLQQARFQLIDALS